MSLDNGPRIEAVLNQIVNSPYSVSTGLKIRIEEAPSRLCRLNRFCHRGTKSAIFCAQSIAPQRTRKKWRRKNPPSIISDHKAQSVAVSVRNLMFLERLFNTKKGCYGSPIGTARFRSWVLTLHPQKFGICASISDHNAP